MFFERNLKILKKLEKLRPIVLHTSNKAFGFSFSDFFNFSNSVSCR